MTETALADYRANSERHADDPQPGDYWHDMFSPHMVVLGRVGNRVIVCDTTKPSGPDHWQWDLDGDGVRMLTLEAFRKELSYKSIPGLCSSCAPGAHKGVAAHWDKSTTPTCAQKP